MCKAAYSKCYYILTEAFRICKPPAEQLPVICSRFGRISPSASRLLQIYYGYISRAQILLSNSETFAPGRRSVRTVRKYMRRRAVRSPPHIHLSACGHYPELLKYSFAPGENLRPPSVRYVGNDHLAFAAGGVYKLSVSDIYTDMVAQVAVIGIGIE